ncbi:SpoIIE family protein phosphatase [Streptomyces virginiae]|uniref:SpoIIE family protein phosphatase n=1 Tax=Streptomyces virginiae TaxID=1961 RepID=UPI003676C259
MREVLLPVNGQCVGVGCAGRCTGRRALAPRPAVFWSSAALGPCDRTEHRRRLPPGSTLLLYTDGLVERRSHDMHATVAQLVTLLARLGDRPLDELLHRISNRLTDPSPEDDVVLLAVRTPVIAQR